MSRVFVPVTGTDDLEDDPLANIPGVKPRKRRPRLESALSTAARLAAFRVQGPALALTAAGVGLVFVLGLVVRMFYGGAIGLSDQGDGQRLTCGMNLRSGHPYNAPTVDLVYTTYYAHQWYGEDCPWNTYGQPYNSSQLYLLQAARWLTPLLHLPGDMDLRALGLICILLLGVLAALLFALLPGSLLGRGFVVGCVWLIFADAAFAGYYVSPYSDTGAIIGVLALVVTALAFWRTETVHWTHVLAIAGVALFTATTKTQAITFAVCAVPLMLSRRVGSADSRWPSPFFGRGFTLVVSGGLVAAIAAYLRSQPARFAEMNSYNAVFVELLPHSPHPEQDLARLGLDPGLITASGTHINSADSAVQLPGYAGFTDKASTMDLLTNVYLHEPQRLLSLMGRGLVGMSRLRADYLFSRPAYTDLPREHENRIDVVHQLWRTMFTSLPLLIVAFTLVSCVVFTILLRVCTRRSERAVGAVGLFLAAAAFTQFWAVNLSEGASDLIKHLMLTNLTTAIVFVFGIYGVFVLRSSVIREKGTAK